MRIKNVVCAAGAAAVLAFAGTGTASAAGTDLDCKDIGHPVDVSAGDPHHLDADGNGTGCESYPGAVLVLSDDQLADTGAGDLVQEHPLRSVGAAGLTIGAGVAVVLVTRRRTTHEGA